MFFHQAVLFLTLEAEFLALVQIIVYAGAVLVLFLFVVYMINLREESKEESFRPSWPWIAAAGAMMGLSGFLAVVDFKPGPRVGDMSQEAVAEFGHVKVLGKALFTRHILSFEAAGVLLLVAVLGAVILTRRIRLRGEEG
jgi:NADH-quinone oxidoreductase subunit J